MNMKKMISRILLLLVVACAALSHATSQIIIALSSTHHGVPQETLQMFGAYPNLLNITSDIRQHFHPVVKLPKRRRWKKWLQKRVKSSSDSTSCARIGLMNDYDYIVKDYTGKGNNNDVTLEGGKKIPQLLSSREEAIKFAKTQKQTKIFDVGRYDEDRRGMYTSALFDVKDEKNRRTVHVGIDIGGPVGTKIYSFVDGIIHSVGYNEPIGDYGNVIVVEHKISATSRCWVLYGHLDSSSIKGKHAGKKVKKGEVIGRIGDTSENGGWTGTHLHIQIAMSPPETHDMPGVVSLNYRENALLEYVDPRYILGELY